MKDAVTTNNYLSSHWKGIMRFGQWNDSTVNHWTREFHHCYWMSYLCHLSVYLLPPNSHTWVSIDMDYSPLLFNTAVCMPWSHLSKAKKWGQCFISCHQTPFLNHPDDELITALVFVVFYLNWDVRMPMWFHCVLEDDEYLFWQVVKWHSKRLV